MLTRIVNDISNLADNLSFSARIGPESDAERTARRRSIALYTELDDRCDQQATVAGRSMLTALGHACMQSYKLSQRVVNDRSMTISCFSHLAKVDLPSPDFLSRPEFGTKFQRDVPLFLEIP